MIFSTIHQSMSIVVLDLYRASGRVATALATHRAGGGRLGFEEMGLYRGGGRCTVSAGYRDSEHSPCFGFITTRTNGYPVLGNAC